MLADIGTAALIVLVVLVATLLPMYAKWRAMQALVDRLARRSRASVTPEAPRRSHDGANKMQERVEDSSSDRR